MNLHINNQPAHKKGLLPAKSPTLLGN